jgi:predicted cupin superfamily sugar epimerase
MMLPEVQALIEHFKLKPMPVEGTLFTNTYRSRQEIAEGKPFCDAIIALYCDEPRSVSLFHQLPVDEIWHFYAGDPLRLVLLYPDGTSSDVIMGNDPLHGQQVQFVVPAGVWQAGHLLPGGRFALFGCTMAPGFTEDMFEGGIRDRLIQVYPDRAGDIDLLGCRPDQRSMPQGSAT